jgi:transketolase
MSPGRTPSLAPARLRDLEAVAAGIRADVLEALEQVGHEHRGHPGSTLSIVEIVTALYFEVLAVDPARPDWPDRDRFVLSKGHGCLALYSALARRGFFDRSHLRTFRSVDSLLQGHPDMRRTPGIDWTSGSLGHGVSAGVGLALDLRARGSHARVTVLVGDGEQQEGLVWEGAMAAAKFGLGNLAVFVDCNGLQGGGAVADVMPLEPLAAKWKAFGWRTVAVDGHDIGQVAAAARSARNGRRPTAVLCRTVKGKGVAYMEGDNRWHQACPGGPEPCHGAIGHGGHPAGARVGSTRSAFGSAVVDLMRRREDIFVVSADARASMGLDGAFREFPGRCVEVGIAEQNLVTIASGLAASGRTVFTASYAAFASMRAFEQIRSVVAHPGHRVVLAGGLGGLSGGIEGVCHHATEDLGILRCVPNLAILNPADATAARAATIAAAEHAGPVYLRLGRDDTPLLFDADYRLEIGKANVIDRRGDDVFLLTSGLITAEVLAAATRLEREGTGCTVVEFPTVKPIDRDAVLHASALARLVVTVEEHGVVGGLGSAVLEVLGECAPRRVLRIGLPDRFLESGTPDELRAKYRLDAAAIAARVAEACRATDTAGSGPRGEGRGDHVEQP